MEGERIYLWGFGGISLGIVGLLLFYGQASEHVSVNGLKFRSVFMDIFEVAMGGEKGSDVRGINYRFSFEGRIRHWLFIPEMKLTGEWIDAYCPPGACTE